MNLTRVRPIRASNGRVQGHAIERRVPAVGQGAWREIAFRTDHAEAMSVAGRLAKNWDHDDLL